jgi:tetratricopeptide (TPR) repeat protein
MATTPDSLAELSLGERAAIGRIEKALFGGGDRLVKVGRYEIGVPLGSGAFGKVYRARDPELARDVALKVTEAPLGDADRDELLAEARVMATIRHPNVAVVHDVGVVEIDEVREVAPDPLAATTPGASGEGRVRVFIVMELVTGANLRDWLAAAPRTRREILDVLRQAGRGLAAAHAEGIVHRDFKPENVLVDGDGRALVIDFGLARAPVAAVADDAPLADAMSTHRIAGTPAYMAPEQLAGGKATPGTDQFAYAVTIWEALHGLRPFSGTTLAELRGAFAQPPRTAGRRLPSRLRGVLARALSADPAARWPSLDAMLGALDVRRGRRLVPVGFAVTAGAAVAGWIVATRPAEVVDPCARPTAELAGVWDAAKRDAIAAAFHPIDRGDAVFAHVASTLDRVTGAWLDARRDACVASPRAEPPGAASDPWAPARPAAARRDPDRRLACLQDWRRQLAAVTDAFARATPEVVDRALAALGELPPVARCADSDTGSPADPARAAAASDKLANARALRVAGRDDASLAELAAIDRDADPSIAVAAALLEGELLTSLGRFDDARTSAHHAFDLAIGVGDRRSAAEAAADLAFLGVYDTGRITDSLQWVQTGQSLLSSLDDALELDAKLANAEGNLLVTRGVPAAAGPAFERAVADYRRIDPDHPALGTNLASLGATEMDRGRLDDAERDLRDGVSRAERDLGPDHLEVATARIELGLVEHARGHYGEAARHMDRAMATYARTLGPDHPRLVYGYIDRALVEGARGDVASAERDFGEAARIARATFGLGHPITAQVAMSHASVLLDAGRAADALTYANQARDAYERSDSLSKAVADATLARALAGTGKLRDGLERARAAALVADAFPTGPGAIRALLYHAYGDLALASHADALAAYELRLAAGALATGSPDPLEMAAIHFALARATSDRAPAEVALREFPRDGDPARRAAIERWLAK